MSAKFDKKRGSLPLDVTVLAGVCALFVWLYAVNVIGGQRFHTFLSPAVEGGISFELAADGPFAFLMTGFVLKLAGLTVATWGMWSMLSRIKQGKLNTTKTANRAAVVGYAILGWMVGSGIEHMGNNFLVGRLNLHDPWSHGQFGDTSAMVLVFLLLSVLYVVQQSIRNAVALQEEVDDLV